MTTFRRPERFPSALWPSVKRKAGKLLRDVPGSAVEVVYTDRNEPVVCVVGADGGLVRSWTVEGRRKVSLSGEYGQRVAF